MAQVVVKVNGRAYTMQCNDGEEPHLAELGELLDSEIDRIKDAVGQVGDVHPGERDPTRQPRCLTRQRRNPGDQVEAGD